MRIAEVVARFAPRERADGGNHAAVELQIIVAVENVMFAVVLIVERHFDVAQAVAECVARVHALLVGGVGVAPPIDVGFGEIVFVLPVAFFNQRQNARPIRARL